jgi:hypothetical protein
VSTQPRSVPRDALWGAKRGLSIAGLYIAWVTVLRVFAGDEPFQRQGTSFAAVIGFYALTGIVSGAIVGMLWPYKQRRFVAYVAGVLAGIPAALGLMVILRGWPTQWNPLDALAIPIFVLGFGLLFGSTIAKAGQREASQSAEGQFSSSKRGQEN